MPASFKRMSSALLMSLQRWLADVVVLESAISLSYSLFDHCPSFWLLPVVNRSRKEIGSAKSAIQSIRPSWKLWLARRFSRVLILDLSVRTVNLAADHPVKNININANMLLETLLVKIFSSHFLYFRFI